MSAYMPFATLKDCPFCGEQECLDYDGWVIVCKVCYAKGPQNKGDEMHEAIEGWNTRPLPNLSSPDRPVEAGQGVRQVQQGNEPVA